MKKIYLLMLSAIFMLQEANSQFNYTVETAYNVPGTYTDLGSSGTVIPTSNKDDANSVAFPIGFNFSYNGTNYSYFILNTNGFIKLGVNSSMTAPSATDLAYTYFNQNLPGGVLNSSNANDMNILSVFNHDLDSSLSGTEYRFNTTGSTGSRVTTIQFKNVTDKNITDTSSGSQPHVQFASMNFQIKLYESNKMIEFVYGDFVPTNDSCLFKLAGVGLKGSNLNQMMTIFKSSSHEFQIGQFQLGNYLSAGVNSGFNFGNNNATIGKAIPSCVIRPLPDKGRTFRFLPQVTNDAEIKILYAKHATAIPWGTPHPIRARITNVGSNTKSATWVYVEVKGVNSYQDSSFFNSLGAGLSSNATFNGYTPENLGYDTIIVTLSSDNENINNELRQIQLVSNEELGYTDSTGNRSNFGWSAGSGIFAAKYATVGKRRISKAYLKIGFNTASVGQSVHGVVVDNAANIVGRTPNHVIACGDMGKWIELDVYGGNGTLFDRPPPVINNNTFYVGMAIPSAGHFPMALQWVEPSPTGTYYYHGGISSGGTYTDLSTVSGLDIFGLGVNTKLDGTALKLEPVTSLNDPSCALPNQVIDVTVTNQDSITVDFAIDTLHLEVSSTGAINQSFSLLVNNGTLDPDSSRTYTITSNFDLSVAGQYDIIVEARTWLEVDTANNYRNFTVNVVDTPDVELKVLPDSILCFGTPFTFIATPYTAGSVLYQWYVNGISQGGTTTDSSYISAAIDYGDTISVDLITDHCTTGTFTIPSNKISMTINPIPKYINGITGIDSVVQLTKRNYSSGITAGHTYLWKVSGGTILTDSTGAAIQVEWGTGTNLNASVRLTETDGQNCTRENILPVHVLNVDGINEANTLGIGEAYPNPADNTVNIPVYSSSNETIELTLYDISGKKIRDIYNGRINGDRIFTIPVSELEEGMYLYKIRTSDGFEKVNRLSIKH